MGEDFLSRNITCITIPVKARINFDELAKVQHEDKELKKLLTNPETTNLQLEKSKNADSHKMVIGDFSMGEFRPCVTKIIILHVIKTCML